jgi:uncharacterized membrane protein (GlpM family)
MRDLLLRFLIGGAVVTLFAILGDIFRPKSFAGLFGAAPSIALATLGLTITSHGRAYAATEARSMLAGAVAFFLYACSVSFVLMRYSPPTWKPTLGLMPVWFVTAFSLWALFLQ